MKNTSTTSLRRKLASLPKLVPQQHLNQSSEGNPASRSKNLPALPGGVGQREINPLPLAVGRLLRTAVSLFHAPNVRTETESRKKKSHDAHKHVANGSLCPHTVPMPKTNSPTGASATKGYANGKRRTNISIQGALADMALKHLPATRHGSLSGFVENMLKREFKARAPMLRKGGHKVPPEVFAK